MTSKKIAEFWPEHADHEGSTSFSATDGFTCACGEALGFPVQDEPPEAAEYELPEFEEEPLSVRMKRDAQEKVDAARRKVEADAEARSVAGEPVQDDYASKEAVAQGAFGVYGQSTQDAVETEPVDAEVVEEVTVAAVPAGIKSFGGFELVDEETPPVTVHEEDADLYRDEADAAVEHRAAELATVERVRAEIEPDEAQATPLDYGQEFRAGLHDGPEPGEPDTVSTDLARREAPKPGTGVPIFPREGEQTLDPLTKKLPALDPTMPYTPQDVELKIVSILEQLENSETFLRQQMGRLHSAEHDLNLKYNLALAQSPAKNQKQQEAEAWLASADEQYEAGEAKMLVKALQGAQHNLRSQLSGFQSVARSLGVSMGNTLGTSPRNQEPPPARPWEH